YNQGLVLLEDAERCPANLRDFTWGHYHRWCKRDRLTIPVEWGWSLAVSRDGGTLAAGTADGLKLYDMRSGRVRTTLMADGFKPLAARMALSPDGQTLVAVGGKAVTLWDLTTAKVKATLPNCVSGVQCLTFSHDGLTVAAGVGERGRPGKVQRWDVRT